MTWLLEIIHRLCCELFHAGTILFLAGKTSVVSQFRVCILWRTRPLQSSMFYPYVTISVVQACESDNLNHVMSPFSLFLCSFSGTQRILEYVKPWRIVAVHPPKTGERRTHLCELSIWDSLRTALCVIGLQMLLWRTQIMNWDTELCS